MPLPGNGQRNPIGNTALSAADAAAARPFGRKPRGRILFFFFCTELASLIFSSLLLTYPILTYPILSYPIL